MDETSSLHRTTTLVLHPLVSSSRDPRFLRGPTILLSLRFSLRRRTKLPVRWSHAGLVGRRPWSTRRLSTTVRSVGSVSHYRHPPPPSKGCQWSPISSWKVLFVLGYLGTRVRLRRVGTEESPGVPLQSLFLSTRLVGPLASKSLPNFEVGPSGSRSS